MAFSRSALHVGVVNDHHDIIPFLHALMRRRIISQGMAMIHFDSHADLCCPSTRLKSPETAWADKHKLYYDVLGDSRTAISEFLIPLMYRGDIGCVHWVRPQWQEIGLNDPGDESFDFDVGFDNNNQPLVSIGCSYYLEEGSYSPEPLREKRRVSVRTCHAESLCNDKDQSLTKNVEAVPWILDVCLDYFSTLNPFLPALERGLRADLGSDAEAKEALVNIEGMFKNMPFRCIGDEDPRELRVRVLEALERLLLEEHGEQHFLELSPSPYSEAFVNHTLTHLSASTKALLNEAGMCVLLPHHPSSDAEVHQLLAAFKATMQKLRRSQTNLLPAPACVTIARSVGEKCMGTPEKAREKRGHDGSIKPVTEGDEDGFTPALQANMIQQEVIQIITEVFLDQERELKVHNLYAKAGGLDDLSDCYQRCYSLFLPKQAPKLTGSQE